MGIPVPAPNVMGEGVFDGREGAIVHVAATIAKITKAGRLEAAHIGVDFRDRIATHIIQIAACVSADAKIMKLVVGEERVVLADWMANCAVAFLGAHENMEATLRLRSKGFGVVTVIKLIEWGIARDDRAFEGGDGLGDHIDGDLVGTPRFLEKFGIFWIRLEAFHNAVKGMSHFNRIGDGTLGLFLKAGCAAIPELQSEVRRIDYRGRMARTGFLANPFRSGTIVRKRKFRGVTRRTRDRAIDREHGVVIETPAESDRVFCRRVVRRDGNWWQAERSFDVDWLANRHHGGTGSRTRE